MNINYKVNNIQWIVHYRKNYQNNYEILIISVLFDYSNNKENDLLKELKVGLQ